MKRAGKADMFRIVALCAFFGVVFFFNRGNTEGFNSSNILCLMFVYVFCYFESGLILWFWDNMWFDDLRAE